MGGKIKKALKIAFVVFIATRIPFIANSNFVANSTFFSLTGAKALVAKAFAYTLALGFLTKGMGGIGGNFSAKFAGRAPTEPRQLVYGQCRVGGVIVHMETTGTDNHLLHMVVALAGHEIESLESVRLNDENLTTTTSTISGSTVHTVTNSKYTNTENENNFGSGRLVRFTFQDGSQTAVDGFLNAQLSSIGTSDKFTDIAYLYIQCVFDSEAFGGGQPNVSCIVKGKKVYDPRLNSGSGGTAWSDNPALIVRDFLTDTTYGLKAKSSEINDGNVAGGVTAAANTCDETVTLADNSSTEKRYTANGFTNFSANGSNILNGVLQAMAGNMSFVNGQFQVFAGAHPTPSLTITDDDLLENVDVSTKPASGGLYNTVKSVFVDLSNDYIAGDAPVYQDSTFLTEDTPNGTTSDKPNYVKTMEKQLPFTTTHTMAQRLQRIALKKQRLSTTMACVVDLKFMQLQPHDTVNVTNERLGFSNKIFEVLSMNLLVQENDDVPVLVVGLTLKETASSVYDFLPSDYQTPVASGSAVEFGSYAISAPSNLSATSETQVNDTYNTRVVIASWTNAQSSLISGTEVQFKRNSASAYSSIVAGNGVTSISVGGLEIGQVYNFRARHFGISGVRSQFTSVVNHTVAGTPVAVSTLTNSNTTKDDVGLGNVDNKSSATILSETHTGKLTGEIKSNGDEKTPAQVIDATNRATAGLDSSGNVNRAVPAAQINNALTTVLTARPSTTAQWVTQDGAVYSPTGTNIDITITADNGTTSETGVFRWSFVNVSNSNADYISGCTEQTDSTNSFSVSVTTDLSGNNQKFAQATVTHDSGETIVISALLSQIHVSGGGK